MPNSTPNPPETLSTTPNNETTKTAHQFYLSDYPNGNQDYNSDVYTISDSQTSDRSVTESGLPKSAQSLPIIVKKDVPNPSFAGRRSCFFPGTLKDRSSKLWYHGLVRSSGHKRRGHKKLTGYRKPYDSYEFLTTGTPLLKYRRWKDPHWRHFEVDTNLDNFIWYSDGKSVKKSRIALTDINEVLVGQQSPEFKRRPRKELEHQSFSIKYKATKYLDLICINQKDFTMWVNSLKQLIHNIQAGNKYEKFLPIEIRQKQERSKEPIYPKKDGANWHKYVDNLERSQVQIRRLLNMSEKISKFLTVHPMIKRLRRLLRKLEKWADDAETSEWLMLSQFDELRMIRVEIRVLQIKVEVLMDALAQENKRSMISSLLHGSSGGTLGSVLFADTPGSIHSVPTEQYGSTRSIFVKPHRRGVSDPRLAQAPPYRKHKVGRHQGRRRRNSRPEVLVSPEWYRCLPKQKKTEIRQIMVDDIVSKSKKLSAKTVNLVCHTYAVSEVEVKALARYLDDKYSDEALIKNYLSKNQNKRYKFKEVTKPISREAASLHHRSRSVSHKVKKPMAMERAAGTSHQRSRSVSHNSRILISAAPPNLRVSNKCTV